MSTPKSDYSKDNFCVILAGGKGRRLWPSSREGRPKQFIDFFGTGRSLLQSTFDRMANIVPQDHIYICTGAEYVHWVKEQLPDLNEHCLMVEPVNRNTAGSVAWAMLNIQKINMTANIVIVPSDQFITDEEAFRKNIIEGLDLVARQHMALIMGIKPSRPEPGYGYIQMGSDSIQENVFAIQSFVEKPEREFARLFMESGEFLWNTGIILCGATYLRECLRKLFFELFAPGMCENHDYTIEQIIDFIERNYASLPNIAIDQGVLQQSDNVYVMKCSFGWADIGTWHSIYESMQKTDGDNVVLDSKVIMEDCRNNIICLPKGHIGVINGLEGYIIAEQDNMLLICPKEDSSALIRKYVNEVGIKYGDEYI